MRTHLDPPLCFNEAPAILPGKVRGEVRGQPAPPSFNEAPAILPGKGLRLDRAGLPGPLASMRPRRFCRGKVETYAPMGSGEQAASMRPRRFCRGKSWARGRSRSPSAPLQ